MNVRHHAARLIGASITVLSLAMFGPAKGDGSDLNHYILDCGGACSAESNSSWMATASMHSPRSGHTATRLQNGKILVAGGDDGTAELYDPVSRTWESTGSMNVGRGGHTATLLPDGRVLVVGGDWQEEPRYFNTAELYDPTTGSWSLTGNTNAFRAPASFTATLLMDGTVLVAGGLGEDALFDSAAVAIGDAELYDPATGTWVPSGRLHRARFAHTATLLNDGRVLIVGGSDDVEGDSSLADAELYDPQSKSWTGTTPFIAPVQGHASVLLQDGNVLVTGGYQSFLQGGTGSSNFAAIFVPATNSWSRTGDFSAGRFHHTATLLPTGHVLIVGGFQTEFFSWAYFGYQIAPLASAELYDPGSGKWTSTDPMSAARMGYAATLQPDGTVLVSGGVSDDTDQVLDTAEVYGPDH